MGNSKNRERTSCPVTSLLRMPINFSGADNADGPFSSDRGTQRQFFGKYPFRRRFGV